jgi:hypothetical protein
VSATSLRGKRNLHSRDPPLAYLKHVWLWFLLCICRLEATALQSQCSCYIKAGPLSGPFADGGWSCSLKSSRFSTARSMEHLVIELR